MNIIQKETNSKELKLIEKTKKISTKEGCSYSFMEGFGLRYITPFAVAIGSNNTQIGLLNSLPSLLGNFSQLFTLKAMDKYSRKKIVFWGVFLQAIMWLAMIAVASIYFIFKIQNQIPGTALIIVYTILIFFGALSGPAWTSWMRDLITHDRGDYFGKRSRIIGTFIIISMLIAGFILDYFKQTQLFWGFAILFFIAFLGRLSSARYMLKQYEPKFKAEDGAYFSLIDFVKKMSQNNFGRFVIYFSLVSLSVAIAGPFFGVYMLKDLNFSYTQFMIISLASTISAFAIMPLWGKFSDKYGNIKVMRLTGPLTIVIPLFWVITPLILQYNIPIMYYLIILEVFSGIIWAGFNLAAGNFIFDAVTRQRIAICSAYFNILNGLGVLIGATLGGLISSQEFTLFGLTPILCIFILSVAARLIVYLLMAKKIKEVREVKSFNLGEHTKEKLSQLQIHKLVDMFDMTKIRFRD